MYGGGVGPPRSDRHNARVYIYIFKYIREKGRGGPTFDFGNYAIACAKRRGPVAVDCG